MITIIYSTHKDFEYNFHFKQHLLQTVGIKDVQILEYENHNQYSLAKLYNKGISESNFNIVCCIHNDIKLEKNWGKKLLEDFSNNPDYGIIGKAGSCYFPESGVYWDKMRQTMVGQVYHYPEGQKKWLSKYSPKLPYLIPVVTIDGLFISFDKTKIKHKFDESFGKFHFYDHGFTIPNYLDSVKIGVTSSFEITHQSVGQPNQEFFDSKKIFLEKYGDKLPLDLKPYKVWVPQIKRKYPKKFGKIAIIIPTKGKVEMLFDCIDSFYQNCDSSKFDVYIADTGSSIDEKEWIKNNILPLGNINLIEYDYYNFSKINNDVVKNHISNDYEFLLFCNNDIKILNDIITVMINQYDFDKRTGTVGCRLHYENNTLQHDGISLVVNSKTNGFSAVHQNSKNYYNFVNNTKKIFGSTAALLMIRKSLFEKIGMFNEKYNECFEDVELNIMSLKLRFNNYICGEGVAYHLESLTRNESPTQSLRIQSDANKLLNTYKENFDVLKDYTGLFYD
jgi:GT2 family glycosyltransferase